MKATTTRKAPGAQQRTGGNDHHEGDRVIDPHPPTAPRQALAEIAGRRVDTATRYLATGDIDAEVLWRCVRLLSTAAVELEQDREAV